MNQKEALLQMRIGNRIRRRRWEGGMYCAIENHRILVSFSDGIKTYFSLDDFITQDHNDWEVYCPQGNEQNPEGDNNVNNTVCTKAT